MLFGLNKFFNFSVPPYHGEGLQLVNSFQTMGGGYIWKLVATIELLSGTSFLLNLYVPLSATLVAPIMVSALLFHVFLDPNGKGLYAAAMFVIMNVIIIYYHKEHYLDLVQ